MFGIGTGELIVLFILVLLIYGPQKLPELAAKLGKFSREARNAFDDVRDAMSEPKDQVKKWGQDMMIPPPADRKEKKSETSKPAEKSIAPAAHAKEKDKAPSKPRAKSKKAKRKKEPQAGEDEGGK